MLKESFFLVCGPLLVSILLTASSSSSAALACSGLLTESFSIDQRLLAAQAHWKPILFTDPKKHNSKSFRYVVHGVPDSSLLHTYRDFIEIVGSRIPYVLSASVISASLQTAFSRMGFILNVPESIIASASKDDALTSNGKFYGGMKASMRSLFVRLKLPPPAEVLKNTKPNSYNEVTVYLESWPLSGSIILEPILRPTVIGVYVDVSNVMLLDRGQKSIQALKDFAKEIDVPFVELP